MDVKYLTLCLSQMCGCVTQLHRQDIQVMVLWRLNNYSSKRPLLVLALLSKLVTIYHQQSLISVERGG